MQQWLHRCKSRRARPCNARRARDTAIHLVDRGPPLRAVTPMDCLVRRASALLPGQRRPAWRVWRQSREGSLLRAPTKVRRPWRSFVDPDDPSSTLTIAPDVHRLAPPIDQPLCAARSAGASLALW